MAELVILNPYKDTRAALVPLSTPIRYRRSSGGSHHVTPALSTSIAILGVSGKGPVAFQTRVEQLEIEFLMALDALSMIQDSDDESEENAESDLLFQNDSHQYELQSRYRLTRKKYKTELWSRDYEPVLQRIRAAAAAITKAGLEESAKLKAARRLTACGCVVQKEKDILDGLLGECMRMGVILGDVGLFLGTLSGAGERCGSCSDDLYGTCEKEDATPTQPRELKRTTASAATTSKSDSKTEECIDLRAYCDHIFTSLQNLHINSNENNPPTFPDNISAAATVSAPLITYLYAAVTEHIAAAQLRAENASMSVAMDRERKQLNATFAEVQCHNEENLSLAAGLLIEAVQVQAQAERARAAAKADLGVSVNIQEEITRRRGVD